MMLDERQEEMHGAVQMFLKNYGDAICAMISSMQPLPSISSMIPTPLWFKHSLDWNLYAVNFMMNLIGSSFTKPNSTEQKSLHSYVLELQEYLNEKDKQIQHLVNAMQELHQYKNTHLDLLERVQHLEKQNEGLRIELTHAYSGKNTHV